MMALQKSNTNGGCLTVDLEDEKFKQDVDIRQDMIVMDIPS